MWREVTGDYQGWTNWETWNTALMIDSERDTYDKARDLVRRGVSLDEFAMWVMENVVGGSNAQSIQHAQEWNEIPEHERLDHQYEEAKEKFKDSPQGMDLYHSLIGGPDVSDAEPQLVDESLIHWQEIYDSIAGGLEEEARYEREQQELSDALASEDIEHPTRSYDHLGVDYKRLYDALMRVDPSDEEATVSLAFHLMKGNAEQLAEAYYPERAQQKIDFARDAVTAVGRDDLLQYVDGAQAALDAYEPPTPPKFQPGDHVSVMDPADFEEGGKLHDHRLDFVDFVYTVKEAYHNPEYEHKYLLVGRNGDTRQGVTEEKLWPSPIPPKPDHPAYRRSVAERYTGDPVEGVTYDIAPSRSSNIYSMQVTDVDDEYVYGTDIEGGGPRKVPMKLWNQATKPDVEKKLLWRLPLHVFLHEPEAPGDDDVDHWPDTLPDDWRMSRLAAQIKDEVVILREGWYQNAYYDPNYDYEQGAAEQQEPPPGVDQERVFVREGQTGLYYGPDVGGEKVLLHDAPMRGYSFLIIAGEGDFRPTAEHSIATIGSPVKVVNPADKGNERHRGEIGTVKEVRTDRNRGDRYYIVQMGAEEWDTAMLYEHEIEPVMGDTMPGDWHTSAWREASADLLPIVGETYRTKSGNLFTIKSVFEGLHDGVTHGEGMVVVTFDRPSGPLDIEYTESEWDAALAKGQFFPEVPDALPWDEKGDDYYRRAKVASAQHWAYVNGAVAFGSEPLWEIARMAAEEAGLDETGIAHVSNMIARKMKPTGAAVAVGTMDGTYPAIWMTNTDRNDVWGAVIEARSSDAI